MRRASPATREPRTEKRHAQVLVLLALTLFGGSGGAGRRDFSDTAERLVDDPVRAGAIATTANRIEDELADTGRDVLAFRERVIELLSPHAADPEPRAALADEFDTRMWRHQERLLTLRDELRGLMTPDEWRRLFETLRADRDAGE